MSALHSSINGVDELAYVVFESGLNEPFRLFHIDVFLGKTIEVSADEINLPKFEVEFSSNSSCHTHRFKSSHSCPSLVIVDPELLGVSLPDEPCLILNSITFPIPLYIIYPH